MNPHLYIEDLNVAYSFSCLRPMDYSVISWSDVLESVGSYVGTKGFNSRMGLSMFLNNLLLNDVA